MTLDPLAAGTAVFVLGVCLGHVTVGITRLHAQLEAKLGNLSRLADGVFVVVGWALGLGLAAVGGWYAAQGLDSISHQVGLVAGLAGGVSSSAYYKQVRKLVLRAVSKKVDAAGEQDEG
jgi:hypothetical protein